MAVIMREITQSTVAATEDIISTWRDARQQAVALAQEAGYLGLSRVSAPAEAFIGVLAAYEPAMKRRIAAVLPTIRGGDAEEQELLDIIALVQDSPFSTAAVHSFLGNLQGEIDNVRAIQSNIMTGTMNSDGTPLGCPVHFMTARDFIGPERLASPAVRTVLLFALKRTGPDPAAEYMSLAEQYTVEQSSISAGSRSDVGGIDNQPNWYDLPFNTGRLRSSQQNFMATAAYTTCDDSKLFAFVDVSSDPEAFEQLGLNLTATSLVLFFEGALLSPDWTPYFLALPDTRGGSMATQETALEPGDHFDASRVSMPRPGALMNSGDDGWVVVHSSPVDMTRHGYSRERGVSFVVKSDGASVVMVQLAERGGNGTKHGIAVEAGGIWIEGSGDDVSQLVHTRPLQSLMCPADTPTSRSPMQSGCRAKHFSPADEPWRAGDVFGIILTADDEVWYTRNRRVIQTGQTIEDIRSVVINVWMRGAAELEQLQMLTQLDVEVQLNATAGRTELDPASTRVVATLVGSTDCACVRGWSGRECDNCSSPLLCVVEMSTTMSPMPPPTMPPALSPAGERRLIRRSGRGVDSGLDLDPEEEAFIARDSSCAEPANLDFPNWRETRTLDIDSLWSNKSAGSFAVELARFRGRRCRCGCCLGGCGSRPGGWSNWNCPSWQDVLGSSWEDRCGPVQRSVKRPPSIRAYFSSWTWPGDVWRFFALCLSTLQYATCLCCFVDFPCTPEK